MITDLATRIHAIGITTTENKKRFDKFESSILNVIQNLTETLKHNIQNQLRELLDDIYTELAIIVWNDVIMHNYTELGHAPIKKEWISWTKGFVNKRHKILWELLGELLL